MALRFPPVGPRQRAAVRAAELRGIAEPLAQTINRDRERDAVLESTLTRLVEEQFARLTNAIFRRGNILQVPFVAGIAQTLAPLRVAERRSYVFIQNQSGANQIILGIGKPPGVAGASPVDGLIIPPNLGFYEPIMVPQDDLWVVASAAATPGILLLSIT